MENTPPEARRGRGRPRQWEDAAAKHRQYRAARRERTVLVDELLHAVRNAHWEEPEVHRTLQEGDDVAVLRTLIAYYRERHWQRWARRSQ
jgi:hypothetical protein